MLARADGKPYGLLILWVREGSLAGLVPALNRLLPDVVWPPVDGHMGGVWNVAKDGLIPLEAWPELRAGRRPLLVVEEGTFTTSPQEVVAQCIDCRMPHLWLRREGDCLELYRLPTQSVVARWWQKSGGHGRGLRSKGHDLPQGQMTLADVTLVAAGWPR